MATVRPFRGLNHCTWAALVTGEMPFCQGTRSSTSAYTLFNAQIPWSPSFAPVQWDCKVKGSSQEEDCQGCLPSSRGIGRLLRLKDECLLETLRMRLRTSSLELSSGMISLCRLDEASSLKGSEDEAPGLALGWLFPVAACTNLSKSRPGQKSWDRRMLPLPSLV